MSVLLLQGDHILLLVLQPLLSAGQLVPQPLVLLTETAHLRRGTKRREEREGELKVDNR